MLILPLCNRLKRKDVILCFSDTVYTTKYSMYQQKNIEDGHFDWLRWRNGFWLLFIQKLLSSKSFTIKALHMCVLEIIYFDFFSSSAVSSNFEVKKYQRSRRFWWSLCHMRLWHWCECVHVWSNSISGYAF